MTTIINSYFNKHPMPWEIIHCRLLHPYGSFMKAMCCHKNITVPPKHRPKKIYQAPLTICYTSKMMTFPKGTTFEKTKLQPGELIHMEFAFYNVTSIRGFTSMIDVVCAKTRMIWVFTNASKRSPVCIIQFILTSLKNVQHP